MIINEKDIAKQVLYVLKETQPNKFKNVTQKDVERIINMFSRVIRVFIRKGYYITLSTHCLYKKERSIRVAPLERNVVTKKFYNYMRMKVNYYRRSKSSSLLIAGFISLATGFISATSL